jgi:deoxyribonuclease-1-like protein
MPPALGENTQASQSFTPNKSKRSNLSKPKADGFFLCPQPCSNSKFDSFGSIQMRKITIISTVMLALFGAGWYAQDEEKVAGVSKFFSQISLPGKLWSGDSDVNSNVAIRKRTTPSIRIASLQLDGFDASRLNQSMVASSLAKTVRQFDVVAVQGIRPNQGPAMAALLELINAGGAHYEWVSSERYTRTSFDLSMGFIFDQASVEMDLQGSYVLDDPSNAFFRDPFVGGFRVRGNDDQQALTFALVSVHLDTPNSPQEVDLIPTLYRSVRNDGRNEDDVIVLGDFYANDRALRKVNRKTDLNWLISDTPTATAGKYQFDNIIYSSTASPEFTGRAGVFDFVRELNLTLDEALSISTHLPVWAELSLVEGGMFRPTTVAVTDAQ